MRHGLLTLRCLTYTYQAKQLGSHFHVISFDQYGVFRSDAVPEDQNLTVNDPDETPAELYIGGMFSFAGIMSSELEKMLIPLITIALALLGCSLRILWIVYKKQGLGTSREPQPDNNDDGILDFETIKHTE